MRNIIKIVKSKFRQCLYPYKKYHSIGPFRRKDGRLVINILKDKHNFFNILYGLYLWEVSNHRRIKKGYEIDHIDGDCTNDVLENLQELSSSNNRKKGTSKIISYNNKNSKKLFLWCPVCGERFKISRWKVNLKKLKKGKEFHFCCKDCAWEAQKKSFIFPDFQKFKRIKLKEFTPANQHEGFKKFSKPIYIEKKVRICDCGNELREGLKYCCKECRIKYGDTNHCFKVDKEKLIKYCKRSLRRFGRYNYSWIGRKLGVSNNAVKKNIIKYNL